MRWPSGSRAADIGEVVFSLPLELVSPMGYFFKLLACIRFSNTDPFAAWFVVTGDATPDGIRVVRSVLGAIYSLPIVVFRGK